MEKYLYKILSLEDWMMSGDLIHLSAADHNFIHFSTEEQLPKIIDKYWSDVPEFIILKIETQKLTGNLIFETNPGGTTHYYHLYQGSIPRAAVIESTRSCTNGFKIFMEKHIQTTSKNAIFRGKHIRKVIHQDE